MRIGQSFTASGVAARRSVDRSGGKQGFAATVGSGASAGRTATLGLAPLASLDAILAVQEVDDALGRRRRSRARGEQLLDALDEVRLALLDGWLPAVKLEAIRRLATERRRQSGDARLEAVLDEIELRAAVELAKLEQAAGGS